MTSTTSVGRGQFGKGWHRDKHPDVVTRKVPQVRALFGAPRGGSTLPAEVLLDSAVDVVRDQGQTSACVGFASARGVHMRCALMNTPIAWPAPKCIYDVARMKALSNPDDALADTGSQPYLAAQGMQEWGIPSDAQYPFDPDAINVKPTLKTIEEASSFILNGIYRIDLVGTDRVVAVQQAFANNFPVMLGVDVDQAFEDWNPSKAPVTAPVMSAVLGGHMLCLTGYTTKTGSVAPQTLFRGVNSWGPDWGDHGFFWTDTAWLTDPNAGDLYVFTVAAAAA